MNCNHKFSLLLIFIVPVIVAEFSVVRGRSLELAGPTEIQIGVGLNRLRVSGGESVSGKIEVRRNGNTQELVFRLEVNNPIARLSITELRLKPDQSSASFELFTSPTPLKAEITVKVLLQPADQLQAQRTLEIVPALLKSVTLNQPTLHGTRGARMNVRAELNAAAPVGGIELYLDLYTSEVSAKNLRVEAPNPRVQAGSRELAFDIEYDRLYILDERIRDGGGDSRFNADTRTVDLVVALEVQTTKPWSVISGVSKKVSFDVIPLRVASISVQPAAVAGGGESLATFVLNIPPGPNEQFRLSPTHTTTTGKAWARLLGSSCQVLVQEPLLLSSSPGVTNYSFKVCTAAVTTVTTGTLNVSARGGIAPVSISVQP